MKSIDLTGKQFGQLVVLRKSENRHKHKNAILWVCKCDCGKEKELKTESLNGGTISCGCARGSKKGDNTIGRDEFLRRSKLIHGNKYLYNKVVFTTVHDKVLITCTKHGDFSQAPRHNMEGRGCRKCAADNVSVARSSDTQTFIEKAEKLHGSKFDYSSVEYVRSLKHVQIKCNTCHKQFSQTPEQHLSGYGCASCGHANAGILLRSNKVDFVAKATKIHSDKYDYSEVVYTTSSEKVSIHCKSCEKSFMQKPNSHLSGKGCPHCPKEGGFDTSKDGILYILKSSDLIKIGVTNVSAESRARNVSLSSNKIFTVFKTFNLSGKICAEVEFKIIRSLRLTNKSPTVKFDGYTECFYGVDATEVSSMVEKELEVYHE